MRLWIAALVLASAAILSAHVARADGPSFDCAKASTRVEKVICASPELSDLDAKMSQSYQKALHASDANSQALVQEQKSWLAKRDKSCVPKKEPSVEELKSLAACFMPIYLARIDELNNPDHEPTTSAGPCDDLDPAEYGVLVDCFDSHHKGIALAGSDPFVSHAAKLFDVLTHQDGPIKAKIEEFTATECQKNFPPESCGYLSRPNEKNTVVLADYAAGAGDGGALLRSFLTWSEAGSGHFTRPALAFDFEARIESHISDEGNWSTITTSLTGMSDYTDDRLPHVDGLPKPTGCFGCP